MPNRFVLFRRIALTVLHTVVMDGGLWHAWLARMGQAGGGDVALAWIGSADSGTVLIGAIFLLLRREQMELDSPLGRDAAGRHAGRQPGKARTVSAVLLLLRLPLAAAAQPAKIAAPPPPARRRAAAQTVVAQVVVQGALLRAQAIRENSKTASIARPFQRYSRYAECRQLPSSRGENAARHWPSSRRTEG
jgi:hypothetical protein